MSLDGRSILVFEDDMELARSWVEVLEARGAETEIVRRRTVAEDRCRERRFDLVVCDIIVLSPEGSPLPDGGVLLIGHLRNGQAHDLPDWCRSVPILAVTGAGVAIAQNARGVGADHALLKPFKPDLLADRVEAILAAPAQDD